MIRTKKNFVIYDSDIYGIKLLTRLRSNFSQLNEHKTRHNDTINLMCNGCANFFRRLYLPTYVANIVQRLEILNGVSKFDSILQNSSEDQLLITVLLYVSEKFASNINKEIIRLTINFLKASERFVQSFYLTNDICIYFFYLFILFIYSFVIFYILLYRA